MTVSSLHCLRNLVIGGTTLIPALPSTTFIVRAKLNKNYHLVDGHEGPPANYMTLISKVQLFLIII